MRRSKVPTGRIGCVIAWGLLFAPQLAWCDVTPDTLSSTEELTDADTHRLPNPPPDAEQSAAEQLDELSSVVPGESAVAPAGWQPRHWCEDVGICLTDPLGTEITHPTVAVTGFFQADAIWFAQDDLNEGIVGDAQDIADFRRARLAAKGQVAENVSYMAEYDFAFPGRPSFMDVYLDIAEVPYLGNCRVGQWRQPFGMAAMTSVRELMFLERALPFAMLPFRQMGIGFYDTGLNERVTWALSGYRYPTDVFGNAAGDSGYGMSTRLTALLHEARCNDVTHIGFGYTWNRPSTDTTRIRTAPEVGFNQLDFRTTTFPVPFFIDTGVIPTDTYQVVGAEFARSWGSFLFQSEAQFGMVDQLGGPRAVFPGFYAQASYVLTGEQHPYNKQAGVFSRVIPVADYGRRGGGAWEVAGRWSYLDLEDANVDGGRLQDLTFGLNWYLNRFTKFQFNYVHAFLERPAPVESDADIFAVRAQLDF